jgi:threonine/homoserine/homoserine lactone efflux protein
VAALLASEPVFRAIRLAGAAYLIWLGLQSLRAAVATRGPAPAGETVRERLSSRAAFGQGIVAVSGTVSIGLGVKVAADAR